MNPTRFLRALSKNIPEILKKYERIYMVADSNTYKVAGEMVESILKAEGKLLKLL